MNTIVFYIITIYLSIHPRQQKFLTLSLNFTPKDSRPQSLVRAANMGFPPFGCVLSFATTKGSTRRRRRRATESTTTTTTTTMTTTATSRCPTRMRSILVLRIKLPKSWKRESVARRGCWWSPRSLTSTTFYPTRLGQPILKRFICKTLCPSSHCHDLEW